MAEEQFEHTATTWTVGQLKSALEGLPDDMPVRAWSADAPGDKLCEERVVVSAAAENDPPTHFGIDVDFPAGTYYRYRDEEEL